MDFRVCVTRPQNQDLTIANIHIFRQLKDVIPMSHSENNYKLSEKHVIDIRTPWLNSIAQVFSNRPSLTKYLVDQRLSLSLTMKRDRKYICSVDNKKIYMFR